MTRTSSGGRAPIVDAQTARLLSGAVRRIGYTKASVIKAPTDGSGRVTALVSTFGPPPDAQGDIIEAGAFAESIARAIIDHPGELWTVWWNHNYRDPGDSIGVVTAASETEKGLIVEIQLDLTSERALKVYEGLLAGRIREYSIGFAVVAERSGHLNGKSVNYLETLELLEISVVWKGANRSTRTLDVKSATSTSATNATDTWTTDENDPAVWMERIEQAAYGRPHVDAAVVKQVDDLVLATKLELIQESIDRAKQAGWEEQMLTNIVLDPVPVRVDARMRPGR